MNVSFVIPAKNEQGNIRPLVTEITQHTPPEVEFEIIYVDDGSTDGTLSEIRELANDLPVCLRVVQHEKSMGQSTAIMTGVRYARYEWIITLDADGQNDPADIPHFIEVAARQPIETDFCVAGYRKNRKDTAWKRFGSRFANSIRQKLLNDGSDDSGCGTKVVKRDVFLELPYFDHMHRYMPAMIRADGYEAEFVDVNHRDREHGISKYNNFGRLAAAASDLRGVTWLMKRRRPTGGVDEM